MALLILPLVIYWLARLMLIRRYDLRLFAVSWTPLRKALQSRKNRYFNSVLAKRVEVTNTACQALRTAISARLTDSNISVIEALYSKPTQLIPILSDLEILNTLSASLISDPPSRAILRSHLSFLFNHLISANSSLGLPVILNFVLPHALYTKPRSKTAASVWEVISDSPLKKHKL